MNEDTKTPEPVAKFAAIVAGLLILLTSINPVADHFGWWHFTTEDMNFIQQLVGAILAFIVLVAGVLIVRPKVTPNDNVALTKQDAQVLEAAKAPAVDEADFTALKNGTYPPHEGDAKP